MLSARSWSLIFCAASSWAMRARCSSWAWTTSASALARAADSRRRASATSLSTALMLRLLNERPRSSSSREQASLMITASSSSSRVRARRRQRGEPATASAVLEARRRRRARARAGVEELVVLEQVDGAPPRRREHVRERRELLARRLGEELVGGGVHHRLVLADADDGRGLHGHLDRRRAPVGVDVGRLVGDLDVDVDGLRRDDPRPG